MCNLLLKYIVCLVFVAASLVGCGARSESDAALFEQARQYYTDNEFLQARTVLLRISASSNKSSEAQYLLGLIALKENQRSLAIAYFNDAATTATDIDLIHKVVSQFLSLDHLTDVQSLLDRAKTIEPDNLDTLALEAWLRFSSGNKAGARELAEQVLTGDPASVRAITVLAAYFADLDDMDSAMKLVASALESQTRNDALKLVKVRLLQQQGRSDDVVATFRELIRENPDNLLYSYQLANYLLTVTSLPEGIRKDQAEQVLRQLVDHHKDNDTAKIWLVEFLARYRSTERARDELLALIADDSENLLLIDSLAKIYLAQGDDDSARQLYLRLIADSSERIGLQARTRLISIASMSSDRALVEQLVDEILLIDDENSNALTVRARLKLMDQNYAAAIEDLDRALNSTPTSLPALSVLAAAYERSNQKDEAIKTYRRLLNLDGNQVDALISLAKLLMMQDDAGNESQEKLERALAIEPENPQAIIALCDLYSRNGRWDEALALASGLIQRSETRATGFYLKGRVYLRQKQFNSAVEAFKESLALDERADEALSALVSSYLALEQADKAAEFLSEHLQRFPKHAHAVELMASLLQQADDNEQAIALLTDLLEREPSRLSAYRALGQIYRKLGRLADVEALYKKALANDSGSVELQAVLAELYVQTGRIAEARQLYERVLAARPDLLVVQNNLAALLADHYVAAEDLDRAEQLVAGLIDSDIPAFLDTAGWVLYQRGRFDEAVPLLQRAVAIGGAVPLYQYHLGMAYYKTEQPARARRQLHAALSHQNVEFPGLDDARRILALIGSQ